MKQHIKFFLLFLYLIALFIILGIFGRHERNCIMGYPIISEDEISFITAGKNVINAQPNDIYFQEQPIPYVSDLNTFLIPVATLGTFTGNISCVKGQIYFVLEENQDWNEIYEGKDSISLYIINNSFYIKTYVAFTSFTVLTFQTDAFENGNAYGEMKLYTPLDGEINMYSYKYSEAKISYDEAKSMLSPKERNYELKLFKNGVENKINLAGLRKDDDWELDSLVNYPSEILQFYEEWNSFCTERNEKRFKIQYQIVKLYMDEQFMGDYLLRVPIDNKQLKDFQGTWITNADMESAIYSQQIQELFNTIIRNADIGLECYFWQENEDSLYAIPRRFSKATKAEYE